MGKLSWYDVDRSIVDQVVPRDLWLIKSANQIMATYAFSQETN